MKQVPFQPTKLIGILGHPLTHSLSPLMHNAAFRVMGLGWRYVPIDLTGVEASDAVMVGDTTHDLELAANAGVDAVAVTYGAHDEELLATRPAKARLSSVADLHRWLAARN